MKQTKIETELKILKMEDEINNKNNNLDLQFKLIVANGESL